MLQAKFDDPRPGFPGPHHTERRTRRIVHPAGLLDKLKFLFVPIKENLCEAQRRKG
jgi:hypothetical protein